MDAIKKKGKARQEISLMMKLKEYQRMMFRRSTDKYVAKIDAAVEEKSKEILTV